MIKLQHLLLVSAHPAPVEGEKLLANGRQPSFISLTSICRKKMRNGQDEEEEEADSDLLVFLTMSEQR